MFKYYKNNNMHFYINAHKHLQFAYKEIISIELKNRKIKV